ncbi:hypothetical protein V6N13_056978 [Hibiscus sabdariffa]
MTPPVLFRRCSFTADSNVRFSLLLLSVHSVDPDAALSCYVFVRSSTKLNLFLPFIVECYKEQHSLRLKSAPVPIVPVADKSVDEHQVTSDEHLNVHQQCVDGEPREMVSPPSNVVLPTEPPEPIASTNESPANIATVEHNGTTSQQSSFSDVDEFITSEEFDNNTESVLQSQSEDQSQSANQIVAPTTSLSNKHPMVTRSKRVMEEYSALLANGTWELV